MTRILVEYKPNTEYYHEYIPHLTGTFVFDLDKLRAFVASPETDDYTYSLDEAEGILSRYDSGTLIYGINSHDKYSFFDTKWEREKVLSEDQTSIAYCEIAIYLNM